ncbi:PepSY-associated TM helix domain-containing protein [Alteraurantiacibacter aquimixticola]|nr:PepSY-associated TM helix domain-containing protein [Alteraurantiacibacter aquimixticola]
MSAAAKDQTLVQRALSGHAALGLLAGALIYLIALTGTMVVVLEKWQRWEQPNIAESIVLSPEAAQASIPNVLARESEAPATEHLYIRMPTEDLPRAVVTTDNKAWYVDGEGEVVGREAHTWTEFVAALHINLTLPIVWGMILVGVLGVVLAALLVTGVLAHPKIFKDAFRLRSRHDPQLARADWHNRLGVWTLPFALAISLTGAFIGLSYTGAGTLAYAHTDSDLDRVYSTIFGDEPEHDPTSAPMANIARAMETVAERFPETFPTYVVVHDPMTEGQFVQIIAEHPRRLIYGEVYSFNGAGDYLGKVGTSDGEIGRQAAASTYNLHFGNYAGLPVELAYIAFGLALCVITSTGTTLWLRKRRRKGLPTERMAAAWTVTIWGIPLALLAMAWLRFLGGPDVPLVASFWGLLIAGLLVAVLRPSSMADDLVRRALGIAMLVSALVHATWFWNAPIENLLLDVAIAIIGLIIWRPKLRDTAALAA